jgi:hypothetical protein
MKDLQGIGIIFIIRRVKLKIRIKTSNGVIVMIVNVTVF